MKCFEHTPFPWRGVGPIVQYSSSNTHKPNPVITFAGLRLLTFDGQRIILSHYNVRPFST